MKKKRIIWRLAASVCTLLALFALGRFVFLPLFDLSGESQAAGVRVYGYEHAADVYTLESDGLLFTLDPKTTHFTVTKKSTGFQWHSNPPGADSDPIALSADKANLKSILTLIYSTANGVNTQFNNWTYSVEREIYEIEPGEDSLSVRYSLGKVNRTFVIPLAITESRMNGYFEGMSAAEQKAVKEYYRKVDLNKLRATDNAQELVQSYPDLEVEPVYVLRDKTADYLKERMEGYFEKAGYDFEAYQYDLSRSSAAPETDKPVFDISLVYRLIGDELVVEVPYDEMDYNPAYPITKLSLLPNFGAGDAQEEGFLLVPDGGGALIAFNNGKLTQNSYFANVYGWDYAQLRKKVVGETRTAFPVFGISKQRGSFLCLMEDGASNGGVQADISGRFNSYNTVSAAYTILHQGAFEMAEKAVNVVYLFEARLPQGCIRQRYRFLDESGYVPMAQAYREYLLKRYPGLAQREASPAPMPVAIEILGAADKVLQKGGLPTSVPLMLTTYADAQRILQTLTGRGFQNMRVKLSGAINGGLKQKILTKAEPLAQLGGQKGLQALAAYCADSGIPLYLDGVTHFAYDSTMFDGFIAYRDAAQYTTREEVALWAYSPIWYGALDRNDPHYLLKPAKILENFKTLAAEAKRLNMAGISLRDTGYLLSADYNPKNLVTREESIALQRRALQGLREGGQGLMIPGGNDYAVEFADLITDMDLDGSRYSILDAHVPFYQMALSGLVPYAGEPINLAGDYETEILLSAETGAGLSFAFMSQPASVLQDTEYSAYFGADFALWLDRAADIYGKYEQKLGGIIGRPMTDHRRLENGVSVTSYLGGGKVYVNWGYEPVTVDGIALAPRSYQAKGGGGT